MNQSTVLTTCRGGCSRCQESMTRLLLPVGKPGLVLELRPEPLLTMAWSLVTSFLRAALLSVSACRKALSRGLSASNAESCAALALKTSFCNATTYKVHRAVKLLSTMIIKQPAKGTDWVRYLFRTRKGFQVQSAAGMITKLHRNGASKFSACAPALLAFAPLDPPPRDSYLPSFSLFSHSSLMTLNASKII